MGALAETRATWPERRRPAWRVFAALLLVWVLVAAVQPADNAQDIAPFLVAGELLRDQPDAVYLDDGLGIYDLDPRFREASCRRMDGLDCDRYLVAFVSPPAVLPLLIPLSELPNEAVVRFLRVLIASSLALGMAVLWRRLAGLDSRMPTYLVFSAAVLTPFAMLPINLGQSSPLMFLSAVLGVSVASRSRWWAAAVGTLWGANVVMKAMPALLGGILLLQRRRSLLFWTVGGIAALLLLALWLGGVGLFGDFLAGSRSAQFDSTQSPYSGSIESGVREVSGITDHDQLVAIGVGARLLALPVLVYFVTRAGSQDLQWALGWGAVTMLSPLNWWHYGWVFIGLLGVLLWSRDLPGRYLWLFPVAAATTLPVTLATVGGARIPLVQFLWMIGMLVLCIVLSSRGGSGQRSEQVVGGRTATVQPGEAGECRG